MHQTLRSSLALPPALELLKTAIQAAGYPDKVVIGMDVAASEFFRNGKYDLDFKSPDDPARHITGQQLGDLYKSFIKNYPGETPQMFQCTCLSTQQLPNTLTSEPPLPPARSFQSSAPLQSPSKLF